MENKEQKVYGRQEKKYNTEQPNNIPHTKPRKYNQLKAYFALAKASFISIVRSPEAVFFGFAFPMIFILVFGLISGGTVDLKLGVEEGSSIENPVYTVLETIDNVTLIEDENPEDLKREHERGSIDALIKINEIPVDGEDKIVQYNVDLTTTSASPQNTALLENLVSGVVDRINLVGLPAEDYLVTFDVTNVEGREYKTIDFILPGQLGFALLSTAVFGTAFTFITLRQTLVLKRFFATPTKKSNIILAEGTSSLMFSLIQSSTIIVIGAVFLDYTLVNGMFTFIQMVLVSALALFVFMGFGFIISSVAKNERTASPLANVITLPQFLLAGTFFELEAFPGWLQAVSKMLPLTYLNDALRHIAFDGFTIFELGKEIGILCLWGVILYLVAIRLFKWEA